MIKSKSHEFILPFCPKNLLKQHFSKIKWGEFPEHSLFKLLMFELTKYFSDLSFYWFLFDTRQSKIKQIRISKYTECHTLARFNNRVLLSCIVQQGQCQLKSFAIQSDLSLKLLGASRPVPVDFTRQQNLCIMPRQGRFIIFRSSKNRYNRYHSAKCFTII